jgi:hypothetical protein
LTLSPVEIEQEVRYVHRHFTTAEFVSNQPAARIDAVIEEVIQDFKDMAKRYRPLSSAERAIVSLYKPRTAALLADRVWVMSEDADANIGFGWELPMEIRLRSLHAIHHLFERAPGAPPGAPVARHDVERYMADVERDLARGFQAATGATVSPLYSSVARRDAQYQSGDQPALVSIVENLQKWVSP